MLRNTIIIQFFLRSGNISLSNFKISIY